VILLAAFVLVAVACLGGAAALAIEVLNNRDPLLAKRKPYGCSCCNKTWDSLSAFYAHRCVCERVR
jgi:hypothetical protein